MRYLPQKKEIIRFGTDAYQDKELNKNLLIAFGYGDGGGGVNRDLLEARRRPYNEFEGTGTGFSFTNYNAHEMLNTIRYAERVYYDRKREWNKIVDRGMAQDNSWNNSAKQYEEMYTWLAGY